MEQTYTLIEGGMKWDAETLKRMGEKKALEPYGYKVYSQNDEDGILREIFSRIGTTNNTFLEFGVQDGLESNGHLLLFYGWRGYWIEGSADYCAELRKKFRPVIERGQLTVKNAFINKDNINNLIEDMGVPPEIDLLSIDIDGNDWFVWEAIRAARPRAVAIEYNAKFPPDLYWVQAYSEDHVWDGSDWHGASLKALEELGREKGFRLAGTNYSGCNAFFVREDLAEDRFYGEGRAEELYNPPRQNVIYRTGHPAKYCLAVQNEGLGKLNYQDYELLSGFNEVESDGVFAHVWMAEDTARMRVLLPAGAGTAEIPVHCPKCIADRGNYTITAEADGEVCSVAPASESEIITIPIKEPSDTPRALSVTLRVPYTWTPAELLGSADTRRLGADIALSEIRAY